jgi:SAM-dependent methyltransferase
MNWKFIKSIDVKIHFNLIFLMVSQNCRFCSSNLNKIFVDLGKSPLANSYLKESDFDNEKFYPLCIFLCEKCFLVQLEELETPENIFSDYAYFSSFSSSWLKHATDFVDMIISRLSLDKNSLVVEIASNDGYLLQNFVKKNIPVLGIEPARNVAKAAIEKNIPTKVEFFDSTLAKDLTKDGKYADLIIGNNVLAHVPCLNNFIDGLKILLKPSGIITLEFPHLLQLMKNNQFDTIYHEHFSYFSLLSIQKIFSFHGFQIFDVEELSTHGGSMRIFITHLENKIIQTNKNVEQLILKEKEFGLDKLETYKKFSENILHVKSKLINFFNDAKQNSKKIVCYGAPAKGNTLLNYCNITRDLVEYAVDKSPYKQGMFLPGTHIPIYDPKKIEETKPDYVLILPWNLSEEIMKELYFIRNWNGKFVIPIPEVKVLS